MYVRNVLSGVISGRRQRCVGGKQTSVGMAVLGRLVHMQFPARQAGHHHAEQREQPHAAPEAAVDSSAAGSEEHH